ncbi:UNVERIFIED_ORG: hypothetical protein ABID57_000029 [Arthrobacter sp. UYEF1]
MAELAAAQILAGQGTGHRAAAKAHDPASRTAEALAATRWSIRR